MLGDTYLKLMRQRREAALQVVRGEARVSYGTWRHVFAEVLADEMRLMDEVEAVAHDQGKCECGHDLIATTFCPACREE